MVSVVVEVTVSHVDSWRAKRPFAGLAKPADAEEANARARRTEESRRLSVNFMAIRRRSCRGELVEFTEKSE